MNEFVRRLNRYHLCTWYILPLIDLNSDSFGNGNFMNAYLVNGKMKTAVQVADRNLCPAELVTHPCYSTVYERNEQEFLVFEIPEGWKADVENYIQGTYSKFTFYTKGKIQEKSGLNYQARDNEGQIHRCDFNGDGATSSVTFKVGRNSWERH